MRVSIRKSVFQTGLAIILGLALSGCDAVAGLGRSNRVITVEASATELAALAQSGLSQDGALTDSLPVLRRRFESVSNGSVTVERAGSNRVRITMPDTAVLKDAHHLTALLGAGGKLEFRKVDLSVDSAALKAGQAPPGSEILPGPEGYGELAVLIGGGIRGGHVAEAKQMFDSLTNQPVVNVIFDDTGKRQFARMTSQSVGRPIAIMLDGRILAAPIVNEPVSGGMAQISGGFTVDSAKQTASLIQAGYLPVSFTLVQNSEAPRN